jgi:hypothetical protein
VRLGDQLHHLELALGQLGRAAVALLLEPVADQLLLGDGRDERLAAEGSMDRVHELCVG